MNQFKTTHFRILGMFLLIAGLTFTSCKDSSTSAYDEKDMTISAQSVGDMMNNTTANVYISDNNTDTYDPLFPPTADPNWTTSVCYQGNSFGINASWSNPHKAFEVTQHVRWPGDARPHPWENGTFDAKWINASNSMNSIDTKNAAGVAGPGGFNWTRYDKQVAGNGDFVIQLLADNCSWIYLTDENGNSPQLIGYQGAVSTPSNYGVSLDGDHTLIFIIFDGGGLAGGKFRLETTESFGGDVPPPLEPPTPVNTAPVANAGDDVTTEATGFTTSVTLTGSGTDADGDTLSYSWSNGATSASTTVELSVGTHTFTLTVADGQGASHSDDVVITITDTTAPVLSFKQETANLWPPNHKMVLVVTGISASDTVDGTTPVTVTVSSNEAINGKGDGNTDWDWEVVTKSDGSQDVYVRSERSGKGNSGRTYTITMSTSDEVENTSTESIEVTVAQNKGRGK